MAELAAQQKLLKCRAYLEGNPSDVKLIYIFNKLLRFPVTVEILRDTGIGKVVNSFRKREGEIGEKARAVVTQWKAIVSQQDDAPAERSEPDSPSTSHHDSKPSKSKSVSEGDRREKSLSNHTPVNSPHSKNVSKSSSDREHHDKISRTEKEKSNSVSNSSKNSESSHHKAHSSSNSSNGSSSSKEGRHSNVSEDTASKHDSKSSKERGLSEGRQKDKKSSSSSSHTSKKDKKTSNGGGDGGGGDGLSFEDFMNYDDLAVKKKFKKAHNNSDSKKEKKSTKEGYKVKMEAAGSSRSALLSSGSSSPGPVSSGSKRTAVTASSDPKFLSIPSPSKKLSLSEKDILSSLPETQTHYHPWRLREVNKEESKNPDKKDDLDAVLAGIKSRTRESVYSGKRTVLTEVPTLFNACIQVLIDNIDSLEYVGGIPFDILQPVLERCTVSQLYTLEDYNPHFLEESDKLWKIHSQRDFRSKRPDEMETWRELYLRLLDEREARLKAVRANITASMSKAAPERTVKMAFVEAPAKPPRDVRRRQLKFGTGTITKEALGPYRTYKPVNKTTTTTTTTTSVSAPSQPSVSSSGSGRIQVSQQHRSTKIVAPMMAKTMKMMKRMQRR